MTNREDNKDSAAARFMIGRAKEITVFCINHGAKCFANWPVRTLFEYVFFHLVDGGCFVVRGHGEIQAVMFMWGTSQAEIRARAEAKLPSFNWKRSRQEDALFMAEVVARDARTLPKLFKLAVARWPDWQRKKIFTYRAGRLVELLPEVVKRLIYGNQPLAWRPPPGQSRTESGQTPGRLKPGLHAQTVS